MSSDVNPSAVEVRNPTQFAAEAASFIIEQAHASIAARGLFRLGLAGGNTPRAVYAEIAKRASEVPWDQVQISFGDERCVAPDHADSNFKMAGALLDHVPIPAGNVFRLRGEIDPQAAANEYDAKLLAVAARFSEERYRHDLLLLGMGEDGHTASLFPGADSLNEQVKNLLPVIGPKPPPQRVTFTFPLINASRRVCFLVTRKGKEAVLEAVLQGEQRYPSARVRPVDGGVTWFIGA
jgi:6-phosphogluconolactonase